MTKVRAVGLKFYDDANLAVLTARVPPSLARALVKTARANCRTVSGEIRSMLMDRLGTQEDR